MWAGGYYETLIPRFSLDVSGYGVPAMRLRLILENHPGSRGRPWELELEFGNDCGRPVVVVVELRDVLSGDDIRRELDGPTMMGALNSLRYDIAEGLAPRYVRFLPALTVVCS